MTASRCLAMVVATMLLTGRSASVAAEGRLAAAEGAAKATAATAEGKKYEDEVGRAFGRDQGKSIQGCAKEIQRPDLADFNVFLRVTAAGEVEEALVKPSTNLAVCLQGKLKAWKVGTPPQPDQWVNVRVKLQSK